jgi:hypothetical protein
VKGPALACIHRKPTHFGRNPWPQKQILKYFESTKREREVKRKKTIKEKKRKEKKNVLLSCL